MTHYREYGFADARELLKKAVHNDFAVPAFNFVCLEQMLAIIDACIETRSSFILQSSANVRRYIGGAMVMGMSRACVEIIRRSGNNISMSLHLDHGASFDECRDCVDDGYSSVMIDGSSLPFEENVMLTKKVAEYAHRRDVAVEGELGAVSGAEDGVDHANSYTDPEQVRRFVEETGVDSLAVSVGTSHGLNKRKNVNPGESVIAFDRLTEIGNKLPDFPLVLHGASEILPKYVETINRWGGNVGEYGGIPADELRRAVKTTVSKINVASDGWVAATAATREILGSEPGIIDPRKFLSGSRKEMYELYKYKIIEIMNSGSK